MIEDLCHHFKLMASFREENHFLFYKKPIKKINDLAVLSQNGIENALY